MFTQPLVSLGVVALAAVASAKPIPILTELLVPRGHSFNNYGGYDSMGHFDDFYGSNDFSGVHQSVVKNKEIVCHTEKIEIVQQRLAVIREWYKKIISEQICKVEVQTIVHAQFLSGCESFSDDLRHKSGRDVSYDHDIASQIGRIHDSNNECATEDLGWHGYQVGSNSISYSGDNWNHDYSPSSVDSTYGYCQQAYGYSSPYYKSSWSSGYEAPSYGYYGNSYGYGYEEPSYEYSYLSPPRYWDSSSHIYTYASEPSVQTVDSGSYSPSYSGYGSSYSPSYGSSYGSGYSPSYGSSGSSGSEFVPSSESNPSVESIPSSVEVGNGLPAGTDGLPAGLPAGTNGLPAGTDGLPAGLPAGTDGLPAGTDPAVSALGPAATDPAVSAPGPAATDAAALTTDPAVSAPGPAVTPAPLAAPPPAASGAAAAGAPGNAALAESIRHAEATAAIGSIGRRRN